METIVRPFSRWLPVLIAVVISGLYVSTATPTLAQAAFYDDAATNDGGSQTDAVAASITVSAPYALTSIEAPNRVSAANNQKFVVIDSSTNTVLYVSPPKAFAADGPTATYKASDLFPAITLQPGKTYFIGAIVDRAAYYPFRFPAAVVTQGVVTNAGRAGTGFGTNGGIRTYANPSMGFDGLAHSPIRLNSLPVPAPVPTLSEWAMILLGLMLAGGAIVMMQRRRMVA